MTPLKRLSTTALAHFRSVQSVARRLTRPLSSSSDIYFGTNSLNRHSFLRADPQFVAQAITSPYAKLIFFDNAAPIVDVVENKLLTLDYSTLGPDNRGIVDDWIKANEEKDNSLINLPTIHMLGLDTTHFSPFKYKDYTGTPWFAVDISKHETLLKKVYSKPNVKALQTREDVNIHLGYVESNIFAHGKMYLEWISTTPHCRGCGERTVAVNAGSELKCTSTKEIGCFVKAAPVSNASFPRLDPVLITCVLNNTKDKVLMTRHGKFPKGMYTHIAGFIEPAETIEEAVKREVWEESGLIVNEVNIVRSQPWPYPANIMIGCVAVVDDVNLHLEHDMELEHAFWCDLDVIKELINEGKTDEFLTVMVPKYDYGIPNDTTLANKLYQYVAENY